jgi:Family of unknown function (DUF6166)
MKTYHGERTELGCDVTVDGEPLQPRSDLSGNATTAFDWGFVGSGQLSVALLSDFLGNDTKAKAMCEMFEKDVVAELPRDSWTMTGDDVATALARLVGVYGKRALAGAVGGGAAVGDMPVETTPKALAVKAATEVGAAQSKEGALLLKAETNSREERAADQAKRVVNSAADGAADAAHRAEDQAARVMNKAADEAVHAANRAADAATAAEGAYEAAHARDRLADEAMSTANRAVDQKAYATNRAADDAAAVAQRAADQAKQAAVKPLPRTA